MAISLSKGGNVSLSKSAPGLKNLHIGLGWDARSTDGAAFDLDAVLWLEGWLQRFQGTLLLVSHDREFLDDIVNRIVNLENGKLTHWTGNYTDFPAQANVTMDANVRLSTVTGLPGNIRSAVVAPYA